MTLKVRIISEYYTDIGITNGQVLDVIQDDRHIDGSVKIRYGDRFDQTTWVWLDVSKNRSRGIQGEIVTEDERPTVGQPTAQQAGYLDGWLRLKAESMDDDYLLGYGHGAYARATGKHDA